MKHSVSQRFSSVSLRLLSSSVSSHFMKKNSVLSHFMKKKSDSVSFYKKKFSSVSSHQKKSDSVSSHKKKSDSVSFHQKKISFCSDSVLSQNQNETGNSDSCSQSIHNIKIIQFRLIENTRFCFSKIKIIYLSIIKIICLSIIKIICFSI